MTLSRSENPRGRQAFDISIAFTVIACVIVGMRLYTRAFLVRCPGLEDYFIFLALLSTIGFAVCIGFQVHYSMGHHIVDIEPEDSTKSLKAFWVSLIFYGLALGFQKISILLQYLRVFTTPRFTISELFGPRSRMQSALINSPCGSPMPVSIFCKTF